MASILFLSQINLTLQDPGHHYPSLPRKMQGVFIPSPTARRWPVSLANRWEPPGREICPPCHSQIKSVTNLDCQSLAHLDRKGDESSLVTCLWRHYVPWKQPVCLQNTYYVIEHLLCAMLFTYALNLTMRTKKVLLSLPYRLVNRELRMVGTQTNSNPISKPCFFFSMALLTDSHRTIGKERNCILNLF